MIRVCVFKGCPSVRIFRSCIFTLSEPIWIGELGTGKYRCFWAAHMYAYNVFLRNFKVLVFYEFIKNYN
jgi:hypothetical protein